MKAIKTFIDCETEKKTNCEKCPLKNTVACQTRLTKRVLLLRLFKGK